MKLIKALSSAGICLAVIGCTVDDWRRSPGPDEIITMVPWFGNMSEHVAIGPLKGPRQPVPGTVPITGGDPVIAPISLAPTPANIREMDRRFPNPVSRTAESIERGKDRYDINCGLCHGLEGGGDGPIAAAMMGVVPSLVTDRARGYSDGYTYGIIVAGRGLMKRYGHRVRGDDRWHVVNYLRVLQGAAQ